jgi:hypothetical protein
MPHHSLPAVRSQKDLMASRLEDLLQHRPRVRVVVCDEDSRHWLDFQYAHPLKICQQKAPAVSAGIQKENSVRVPKEKL